MSKLIRLPQVLEITGLSRSTIYHLMATSDFPCRYKLGDRIVAWDEDDIQTWIKSRLRSSDNAN